MNVGDLIAAMDTIAPLAAAESWDRAGLQVGSAHRDLRGPVLLTIDLTEDVLAEAIEAGADAVIAYHCPIWDPIERLADRTPTERIIRRAVESRIAIYSPHTALDAAEGGVTDWLCEGLSAGEPGEIAGDCRALSAHREDGDEVKIVTFLPESSLNEMRNALASAGAGAIGAYRVCSFAIPGTGTFFATDDASPVVGERGQLERVSEHRLEMVCPRASLPLAVKMLREFHPYEEPAFDVYKLEAKPRRRVGAGRRLHLDQPATVTELAERLKRHLGRARVRYAMPGDVSEVTTIGVVPGAGASLMDRASSEGCELFVTGEMRHHEVMAALHSGVGVLLAGHTNTERGYLPRLATRLGELLSGIRVLVSERDRDVLTVA